MADELGNRIQLKDTSEAGTVDMADKQEETRQQGEKAEQDGQPEQQTQSKQGEDGWYEKPEGMGNSAGEWVQDKLTPVGKYAGKGFETIGRPIGGIVDPLVGGVMRSGEGWGDQMGIGFGNKDGGPAKQQEAEGERMKQPIAGEEQTGDNPLGLNSKS